MRVKKVSKDELFLDELSKPRLREIAKMKLVDPELGRNESLSLNTLICALKLDIRTAHNMNDEDET